MKKVLRVVGVGVLCASVVFVLLSCGGGSSPKALAKQMYNLEETAIKDIREASDLNKKLEIQQRLSGRLEVIQGKIKSMSKEKQLVFVEEYERLKKAGEEAAQKKEQQEQQKRANAPISAPVAVKAGTPAPASDFEVGLTNDKTGVQIKNYTGSAKHLTIPTTIEDMPVLEVSIRSDTIEQLYVPDGVKSLSFNGRGEMPLRAVRLPSTLESLYGFKDCVSLKSVEIPNGVTRLGESSFSNSGLQTIVIPPSVSSVGAMSFENCKNLVRAEVAGNKLTLRDVFTGCTALRTLVIKEGVVNLSYNFANGCTALQSVEFPSSLEEITGGFKRTGLTSVEIPNGVTQINYEAFSRNENLATVSIPKSVTYIGDDVFSYCPNLVTVTIEEGTVLKTKNYSMFGHCPKLSLASQAAIERLKGR